MFIPIKYFHQGYTIKHIGVNIDLSSCSLLQALYLLDFKLDKEYTIVIDRRNLEFVPKILNGILNLKLEIQDNLDYGFYVVDESNKMIIYSCSANF